MLSRIQRFLKKKNTKITKATEELTVSQLVYTPVHSLVAGMYVAKLDRPWLESPFKFQGFLIETEEELQTLRNVCNYVYIDVDKQKKIKPAFATSINRPVKEELVIGKPPQVLGSFEQEINRAEKNYQEAGILVSDFMEKVASGKGIDGTLAKEAVAACVDSVLHSPDAFLWLSQLKSKDQYTAQHSLNVCVLSIVLGRHIGLSNTKLNQVGLCGMMHDMGKMLVPLEVLNKPGKLEPDELEMMKSHTTLGYELLKSSSNIFHGAVETALTHHERMDGKGYPRQISAKGLSYYSNIVAVADMYDAITSDRVYQKGRTHHEATKIMLDVSESHLDARLVVKFIESLGAYPPGCFVELSDGSIALVIEVNNHYRLRPKILMILDPEKNVVEERVVDLVDKVFDDLGAPISIKAIIKPESYNIDRRKYYQDGVIQKGFAISK